jgi:hypothetical protein
VEWVVADPTDGNGNDPTGTYAYDFGDVPDANSFVAVDVGDAHILPYDNFPFIQEPNWWWSGGAAYNSYTAVTSLQPNGVFAITNFSAGLLQFSLSDPPTEGSVIIEASTNLTAWSPVATNSATGVPISFSLPVTNGNQGFFRSIVVP